MHQHSSLGSAEPDGKTLPTPLCVLLLTPSLNWASPRQWKPQPCPFYCSLLPPLLLSWPLAAPARYHRKWTICCPTPAALLLLPNVGVRESKDLFPRCSSSSLILEKGILGREKLPPSASSPILFLKFKQKWYLYFKVLFQKHCVIDEKNFHGMAVHGMAALVFSSRIYKSLRVLHNGAYMHLCVLDWGMQSSVCGPVPAESSTLCPKQQHIRRSGPASVHFFSQLPVVWDRAIVCPLNLSFPPSLI